MNLIKIKQIAEINFKDDDGNPFVLTDNQAQIFDYIFNKEDYKNRIQVIASTQYGKSNTVAMALILRTQIKKEDWAIVSGDEKKTAIIMGKVIDHLFDNEILLSNLDIDRNEPLDRIRRERSKKKITWKDGGSITAITADARNRKRVKEGLSGLGSPNIIEDEASLIPDDLQAMILRMLGGHKGGFLIKIGNPYNRNHFFETWHSDKYEKLLVDYQVALAEERYTQEFIEEMRKQPFFDILYECKFPSELEFDEGGFRRLLTDTEIINAKTGGEHKGKLRLGFDVGEGGDENVGIIRSDTYAQIVHISKIKDLMTTTGVIIELMNKYAVSPEFCFVDGIGIGAGVVSRLKELNKNINGIKWSEKPSENTYANLKAENYWGLREGIKAGLKLEKDRDEWNELLKIKWKEDSSGKIKIKSKEDMRKEGEKSPNCADALALTYNKSVEDTAPTIYTL
jgi:hypothetical protein